MCGETLLVNVVYRFLPVCVCVGGGGGGGGGGVQFKCVFLLVYDMGMSGGLIVWLMAKVCVSSHTSVLRLYN